MSALYPENGHGPKMNFANAKGLKRLFLGIAGCVIILAATASLADPKFVVSQKGRQFHPEELTIKRGDTIEIINDDADLRHHAYVRSKDFNFDSDDQEPGSKTDVTFPVSGDFNVLCAIHPKMRLVVHVK